MREKVIKEVLKAFLRNNGMCGTHSGVLMEKTDWPVLFHLEMSEIISRIYKIKNTLLDMTIESENNMTSIDNCVEKYVNSAIKDVIKYRHVIQKFSN